MKVALGEKQLQAVLVVRAFEESDRKGELLTENLRSGATRRARMVTGHSRDYAAAGINAAALDGETVSRRARVIYEALRRRVRILGSIMHVIRFGSGTTPTLLIASFFLAFALMRWTTRDGLDLFAWPVYGLVLWNVVAYVAIALLEVVRRRVSRDHAASESVRHRLLRRGIATWLAATFLRWALWRRLQRWRLRPGGDPVRREIVTRAVIRFGALWHRAAGDLLSARVRETLHGAMVCLGLGVSAELALNVAEAGTRPNPRGAWLHGDSARSLLELFLAPASLVTGVPVPSLASPGDAATWSLLMITTVGIFVIVPRTALAIGERLRSRRLANRLGIDTDEAYYRQMFAAWRGARSVAVIHPFGYRPPPPTVPSVTTALYDLFGSRARVHCADPVRGLGGRFATVRETVADGEERRVTRVLLFNLAHDPSDDLHVTFLRECVAAVDAAGEGLLVLIDPAEALARRWEKASRERRLEQWFGLVERAGLRAEELHVGRTPDDGWLARVRAGLRAPSAA